ncbi:MAG: MFS transporter [Candidatus Magasanikbacteria bacterium RIFOXYC12_FULL_33_11]|uniref:MFS transporter n=1 Tax=Candidatus Magasanikbacteria bacterium RIFOXYC12_FULL_33_11 TaxID=1798701 RepID=A0A1F6NNS4_9BACT|nr:MAG: MFS transporter [Candidatus Magasanikbacteria bacterium RIFOXYC12_FULL_33_11]
MNKKIKSLLFGGNLWYFAEGMFGPLLAVFTERIGGDILDITSAWAVYMLVTGFLTIYIGKISDKLNKEKIMIFGYALNAFFTFSYLFVNSSLELFIVQAGLGIAAALATPTWNALYAEHEDKKKEGLEWGLASGAANIVTGIAIIVGGIILKYSSFEVLFVIMGTVQVLATIFQMRILKKKKKFFFKK